MDRLPCIAGLLILTSAFASAAPPPQNRVPPDEAFQACNGKKAGETVSFTTPRGEKMSGKCAMMPARLAAIPDHPPQDGNPPPPPKQ
ncbi:hypothetical protein [Chromobacterium sp. IIBBL 290-4]|uniref:hypothetical protein n=1 Tax=Chromobacterium sp. IIBBL 290-4 TaxID=2953890 RepID=UPI0020B6F9D9|nr:hypothetical protein [Chromobacterium sp. IIBBL 290-4]UTH72715.1 hypothetical protein NKT35_14335 [Chromobacterium sp. IIBBL 290-4]